MTALGFLRYVREAGLQFREHGSVLRTRQLQVGTRAIEESLGVNQRVSDECDDRGEQAPRLIDTGSDLAHLDRKVCQLVSRIDLEQPLLSCHAGGEQLAEGVKGGYNYFKLLYLLNYYVLRL